MLITGASATITDLTGIPTVAGCFLIPLSVVIYVVIGGMRASLLGDFAHTAVLYVIIFVFMFTVYRSVFFHQRWKPLTENEPLNKQDVGPHWIS